MTDEFLEEQAKSLARAFGCDDDPVFLEYIRAEFAEAFPEFGEEEREA